MGVLVATFVVITAEDCSSPAKAAQKISQTISGATGQKPSPNSTVHKASRLPIKRATDEAVAKISNVAKTTTVEAILKLQRPDGLLPDISNPDLQATRLGSFESTVWQVDATITEVVKRADGDFYLVIEGASGAKTVVEVPDPELCVGSKKLAEIKAAREAIEEKFHPTASPQKTKTKARITGLGFFGFARPKDGKPAGNGARIMPGLKVEWK